MADPDAPPMILIRGGASAQEVAAVVAVLQLVGAARADEDSARDRLRSEWAAPRRRVRGPRTAPTAGAGGWRASGLPH